jgi:hypothetical protein
MSQRLHGLLLGLLLASCQTAETDDAIVYKAASAETNARAILTIHYCLERGTCDDLLSDALQCGPFLWQDLKGRPAFTNITAVAQFKVQANRTGAGSQTLTMEGGRFQSKQEVRTFWTEFCRAIPPGTLKTIRGLNDAESRIYWALVRGTIQEPVFIVEGGGHKILMQLVPQRKRARLTFIDDFQSVAIRD